MTRTISVVSLSALILGGCAVDSVEPEVASEEAPILITEVHVGADGTTTERSTSWTRAELHQAIRARIRMAAADGVIIDPAEVGLTNDDEVDEVDEGTERVGESAEAISVEPTCAGPSLWVTDNGSFAKDVNHMICFSGPGSMFMPADWQGINYGATHTPYGLWAGTYSGNLWYVRYGCDAGCSIPFSPWQLRNAFGNASANFYAVYQY
jgi:hypothetical protein